MTINNYVSHLRRKTKSGTRHNISEFLSVKKSWNMELYPDATIVQMDTAYNDNPNGPLIQTFKFLKYDLLFCIYHTVKTNGSMRNGILYPEEILETEIFSREVMVLLTDRGDEFTFSDETEFRDDGTRRTWIYYCDSMSSWQKVSIENVRFCSEIPAPKKLIFLDLSRILRPKPTAVLLIYIYIQRKS